MILREIDLFQGLRLKEDVFDELVDIMESDAYETGQVIIKQGEPADYFYILEQGALELRVAGAKRTTHFIRRPGDMVGWSSVAGRETYTATAQCAEPCRLVRVHKETLDELFRKFPASGMLFYKRLSAMVGERLIQCHQMLIRCREEAG